MFFPPLIPALAIVTVAALSPEVLAVPHVLLYTRTAGYRHESIPIAVDTITSLGNGSLVLPAANIDPSISGLRWQATQTQDQDRFHNASYLAQFDAIGFISTTDVDPPGVGTVLDDQGLRNLATYIQDGGGFFGIHSASATLFGAPFYGRLIGAYFDYHPEIQNVTYKPETLDHPSTSKLPEDGFEIYEEVYNFRSDPRNLPSPAQVLITNASSYSDPGVNPQGFRNGTNGPPPHPLAWYRDGRLLDVNGSSDASITGGGGAGIDVAGGPGRMWYTSLGHDVSTWQQDYFQGHVAGGIGWVLLSSTVRSNNATAIVGQASDTGNTTNGGDGRRGSSASSTAGSSPSATPRSTESTAAASAASHVYCLSAATASLVALTALLAVVAA